MLLRWPFTIFLGDDMTDKILVTGGAGYIGSHTVLTLLNAGYDVVVLDNLSNSSRHSMERVKQISGKNFSFVHGDIRNRKLLDDIFNTNSINSVIHFAGLKAVGESVNNPAEYYDNNFVGSLTLCQAMIAAQVFQLTFSSSATVYGIPIRMPIDENANANSPTSPYGRSKLMVEELLKDLSFSDPRWSIALLRYFNPIGAHPSGIIGEDPNGIPNNLLPYLSQVAIGKLPELSVFGDDYPTPDGTGVRDYIHVVDLAHGHIKALEALRQKNGINIWNLGTGTGYSVLEIIRAFEAACGQSIPYKIVERRAGDIAECWADSSKAELELGWKTKLGLQEMVSDTWRWQSANPRGFTGESAK